MRKFIFRESLFLKDLERRKERVVFFECVRKVNRFDVVVWLFFRRIFVVGVRFLGKKNILFY